MTTPESGTTLSQEAFTWEDAYRSYKFLEYLANLKRQPNEQELQYIRQEGTVLEKAFRTGGILNLVDEFPRLCTQNHPAFVRHYITSFIKDHLDTIEEMSQSDKSYCILPNDPPFTNVPYYMVCFNAVSCLINSGDLEARRQAYDLFSRHKQQFVESFAQLYNDTFLGNLLADPIPPQNAHEEEYAHVADFVRELQPLCKNELFTLSFANYYPFEIIGRWAKQYFEGQIDSNRLHQTAFDYVTFASGVIQSLETIFDIKYGYAPLEAKEFLNYWLERHVNGEISPETGKEVIVKLARLSSALNEFKYKRFNKPHLYRIFRIRVKEFLVGQGAAALLDLDPATQLVKKEILPTPNLVSFVKEKGKDGFAEIKRLKKETREGRFDPANPIQRDLEFSHFFDLMSKQHVETGNFNKCYQEFSRLPGLAQNESFRLYPNEIREAHCAAQEAALLYWFIYKRAQGRQKVVVFGNARYGDDFIVEPLKEFLEKLQIEVASCYIHSTAGKTDEQEFRFLEDYLMREEPDEVIFVDGTRTIGDGFRRFPKSFQTIDRWFSQLQNPQIKTRYQIAHWSPEPTQEIQLGDGEKLPYKPASNEGSFIVLASPMVQPELDVLPEELKHHQSAYFDDIEYHRQNILPIILGQNGVRIMTTEELNTYKNEQSLTSSYRIVEQVQAEIRAVLPQTIDDMLATIRSNRSLIGQ